MNAPVSISALPACPACAAPMALAHTWPRVGALPQVNSYECKRCGIVCSAAVADSTPVSDQIASQYLELCEDRFQGRPVKGRPVTQ